MATNVDIYTPYSAWLKCDHNDVVKALDADCSGLEHNYPYILMPIIATRHTIDDVHAYLVNNQWLVSRFGTLLYTHHMHLNALFGKPSNKDQRNTFIIARAQCKTAESRLDIVRAITPPISRDYVMACQATSFGIFLLGIPRSHCSVDAQVCGEANMMCTSNLARVGETMVQWTDTRLRPRTIGISCSDFLCDYAKKVFCDDASFMVHVGINDRDDNFNIDASLEEQREIFATRPRTSLTHGLTIVSVRGRAIVAQSNAFAYSMSDWLDFDTPLGQSRDQEAMTRARVGVVQNSIYRRYLSNTDVVRLLKNVDALVKMSPTDLWSRDKGLRIYGHVTGVSLQTPTPIPKKRHISAVIIVAPLCTESLMHYTDRDLDLQ